MNEHFRKDSRVLLLATATYAYVFLSFSRTRLGRPRLRVRDAILLVTIIAAVLGWFGRRAHVQRDAVRAIVRAGGTVEYDRRESGAGATSNRRIGWPRWLVTYLGADYFYTVVAVNISAGRGTDAEMAYIGRLPYLEELSASGSPGVTDRGLAHIDGLRRLRALSIHSLPVTDAGLAHLKRLKGLESLYIDSTKVTDAGLVHLGGLTNLRVLGLRRTQVGDPGLLHLAGLTKLSWLLLDETRGTDAGLAHLTRLSALQFLSLDATGVSDAAVGCLQQALPKKAVIVWSAPRETVQPGAGVMKSQP